MDLDRPRSSKLEIALAVVAFGFVAWLLACLVNGARDKVADDAFITYTYARNVVEGHGLRFNASDAAPTAGASSLLHVLITALALAAGLDPLAATRAFGLVGLLTLAITFGLVGARIARAPPAAGCIAGLAVAMAWALMPETELHLASGMDTLLYTSVHGLVACWAATIVADDRERVGVGRMVLGFGLLALLMLARPEGGVLGLAYLAVVACVRRPRGSIARAALSIAPLVAAQVLALIAFALWRWSYYGDVFGTPYYVKMSNAIFGDDGSLLPGAETTARFALLRFVPASILLVALAAGARVPTEGVRRAFWLLMPAIAIALSYSYAIHEMAGGFRYESPMLAPFAAALVIGLCALRRTSFGGFVATVGVATIALPLLAAPPSLRFAVWLAHPRVSATQWWPDYRPDGNALARLGLDLGETGLGQDASILLSGAGRVPYYSRFRAIDWIGLNHNKLCGREALSIGEMWRYLDGLEPDLIFSILPPAAPGSTRPEEDPNFSSVHVQRTLNGRGSALFEHWNHARVAESFWREMLFIRERCEFAASYQLGDLWGDDWWVIVYVRRDSRHRGTLLERLANSRRVDRDDDIAAAFPFDPRRLR